MDHPKPPAFQNTNLIWRLEIFTSDKKLISVKTRSSLRYRCLVPLVEGEVTDHGSRLILNKIKWEGNQAIPTLVLILSKRRFKNGDSRNKLKTGNLLRNTWLCLMTLSDWPVPGVMFVDRFVRSPGDGGGEERVDSVTVGVVRLADPDVRAPHRGRGHGATANRKYYLTLGRTWVFTVVCGQTWLFDSKHSNHLLLS